MTLKQSDIEVRNRIRETSDRLSKWLTEEAWPRWFQNGYNSETGSFFETIALDSGDGIDGPLRTRVPGRQIYCFAQAPAFGWKGPWREVVENGLDWYLRHCRREDTSFRAVVDLAGTPIDNTFDLYNQAFALFALGHAGAVLPARRLELLDEAARLLSFLQNTYSHPTAGFREANPDKLPLRSNPHMHLFEAALALEAFGGGTVWTDLADQIAGLALSRFIDPVSGGLREFFDADWLPMPGDAGRIMEPGHQFEWCWLILKWGDARGSTDDLSAAARLYQIGREYGVDENRDAVIMALNDDFSLRDPVARLWGQTERVKAAVAMARISVGPERDGYLSDILRSAETMESFLKEVPPGLWRDKLDENGTFRAEPAPASSFYHIVCAIAELSGFAADPGD
jgi:mannose/cellobiose epimerase-like protein (N-acyl-D-glucosamine 2-epimerase family)